MAQVRAWLTAAEAAQRLAVKPATLYAYVSRGILSRRRSPTGRSLFDPVEVERLVTRGRPRETPAAAELVIQSRITALGEDRPFYRGRDAIELAGRAPFEAVAQWLWTGDPTTVDGPGGPAWLAPAGSVAVGVAAQRALPAGVLALERLQVIVPALAAADPMRNNTDPAAVADIGRRLIAGMVDCLAGTNGQPGTDAAGTTGQSGTDDAGTRGGPGTDAVGTSGGPGTDGDIAARLCVALAGAPLAAGLVAAVRAALVIVADHELAASTLAVRVAASVRADPYSAVLAGLGTMSGPLHGGASLGVESLLAQADGPEQVAELIGLRLRRGERIPGFGHAVYRPTDARAGALLDRVRAAAADDPVLAVVDAVAAEARRRQLPEPNVDFALAALTRVAGMPIGSGEAIFAIGRTAGWLAHVLEEYEHRTVYRLRAVYIGQS
jgi:citrate synthase